ncbi:MAG: DUF6089 family protein [Saprospiraceae bacterium]
MRTTYLLVISLLLSNTLFAQGTIEGGIFAGLANYGGDLTETNLEITETNPAIGILARYEVNNWLMVRGNLVYGTISGSDINASKISRRKRNLSFRSPIIEFSIVPEFNIYDFELKGGRSIIPYAFIGGGVFYYNPKALYQGEWIDLQPLGTEGQGLPGYPSRYNLIDFSIPGGLGVKFKATEKATISLEWGIRYTFTDYLDDVSTIYPDNDVLFATNGEEAAALSDRTEEYTGVPVNRAENAGRGGAEYTDVYHFFGATISVNLFTPEIDANNTAKTKAKKKKR